MLTKENVNVLAKCQDLPLNHLCTTRYTITSTKSKYSMNKILKFNIYPGSSKQWNTYYGRFILRCVSHFSFPVSICDKDCLYFPQSNQRNLGHTKPIAMIWRKQVWNSTFVKSNIFRYHSTATRWTLKVSVNSCIVVFRWFLIAWSRDSFPTSEGRLNLSSCLLFLIFKTVGDFCSTLLFSVHKH